MDNNSIILKQNSADYEYILSMIQWDIAKKLLPVIVILYLLIFLGIVGNIFAILFYARYSKRTSPTLLITCLAVADLGTCLAAIPIISEMIINFGYSLAILCKITHFFGLWLGACACYMLWLICIDRYRKICAPLAKQMTLSTVRYLVAGVTIFSLLLAARLLVTFNTVEVEVKVDTSNKTLIGLYCTAHEDYNLVSVIFYIIDFLMILMIWITTIVTYSKIIFTIVKRRLSMTNSSRAIQNSRYMGKPTSKRNFSLHWKSNRIKFDSTRRNHSIDISTFEVKTDETEIYTIENCNNKQTDKHCKTSQKRLQKPTFDYTSVRKPSEVKLTFMMFAVAMIFILCFTPYFAIRIFRTVLGSGKEYDFSAWIQFALKLPYINSAFNPVVYFFFNPKLRKYVYACFCKGWFKSKMNVEISNVK